MLSAFEKEYLRRHKEMIYPEELCLILYFVVKNLSGNMGESSQNLVQNDLRFQTLMTFIFNRLPELAYEYVVTMIWSLGICVSGFGLEIPEENKLRLLAVLNSQIDSGNI